MRHRIPAWTSWAAFVVLLVMASGARLPAQNNWRRVDTPNFVAIGEVNQSILRDQVLQFEAFRETLSRLHGARVVSSVVPTVIIAFPTDYAIGPFRPKFNGKSVEIGGLFVPGRDLNYIAMITDGNPERSSARLRVVFHEYTHLVSRNSSQQLPVWLSEGIAEYYSTFEPIKGGREAIIGNVIGEHIQQLNNTVLMPIADLVKIDHQSPLYNEGSRRSVFYAQSWALVHMILRAEPSRTEQLAAYLDRVSHGAESAAAWQEAFGAVNMDQELDRYIRRQSFMAVKFNFGEALAKLNPTTATMTPSDVQAFLSDFQVALDDDDGATARLAELAKRDPSNERANVTTARLAIKRGRSQDVGDRLKAMAPPTDWFLAYLAGVTMADQASKSGKPTAADIQAVEKMFAVTRASGREFPNAVARAAELELVGDNVPSAETESALDRARALAPGRDDYTILHAQILARRTDFAKARGVLGPLMASGSTNVREMARRLMASLVEYESALAGGAAAPSSATLPSALNSRTTVGEPPSKITPLYRQMKAGEQRIEALLENMECVVGKGITFHFKAGDQAVTATATKFDDVEFITFRDDLKGTITCGPVKEPMRVYLTWKTGQTDGTKIAVAIEFLAKDK